jgi:hypothetical protein
MEPYLGQLLYFVLLRAYKARLRTGFEAGGVQMKFDVNNLRLTGTFDLPLDGSINIETGEYSIKAKDFLVE